MASTQKVYSVCLIHNATGNPITLVKSHDFQGQIGPIPQVIPSGQCAMFVHSGGSGTPSQSAGSVVYRCKNSAGQECDWLMSWSNKYGNTSCKVYTEIKAPTSYDKDTVWLGILGELMSATAYKKADRERFSSSVNKVENNHGYDVWAMFHGKIEMK